MEYNCLIDNTAFAFKFSNLDDAVTFCRQYKSVTIYDSGGKIAYERHYDN